MSRIFKIYTCHDLPASEGENLCIGMPVRVAGRETVIPVSDPCRTFEEVARAAQTIQDDLKLLLKEAEGVFRPGNTLDEEVYFPPGMAPDKVWAVLNGMEGEEAFAQAFNQLDEERRGRVAEHVLTKCNIFSGRASVFSARYNSATGFLE